MGGGGGGGGRRAGKHVIVIHSSHAHVLNYYGAWFKHVGGSPTKVKN